MDLTGTRSHPDSNSEPGANVVMPGPASLMASPSRRCISGECRSCRMPRAIGFPEGATLRNASGPSTERRTCRVCVSIRSARIARVAGSLGFRDTRTCGFQSPQELVAPRVCNRGLVVESIFLPRSPQRVSESGEREAGRPLRMKRGPGHRFYYTAQLGSSVATPVTPCNAHVFREFYLATCSDGKTGHCSPRSKFVSH